MNEWLTALRDSLAIAVIVVAAFSWVASAWLKKQLSELRPNGGSTVKDKVDKLDRKIDKLEARVDVIYDLLIDKRSPKRK